MTDFLDIYGTRAERVSPHFAPLQWREAMRLWDDPDEWRGDDHEVDGFIDGLSRRKPIGAPEFDAVNTYVNRFIAYERDADVDDWTGPFEVLTDRAGDCEEYALMKWAILRAIGVEQSKMAVTVVRDLVARRLHAFLVVRVGNRTVVLDSRTAWIFYAGSGAFAPLMSLQSDTKVHLHGFAPAEAEEQAA